MDESEISLLDMTIRLLSAAGLAFVLGLEDAGHPLQLVVVGHRHEVVPVDQHRDVSLRVVTVAGRRGTLHEPCLEEHL